MTIHLIEDDDIYAEFIKRSLSQDATHTVITFRSAEDCLAALNGGPMPDAFIVDYKLPGKTGIDFYDEVKDKLKEEQHLIMMSAIDDGNMVLSFIRKGVRDYVIKDDTVVESLRAILDGQDEDYYLFN
ncbi:MAG: response regulator [Cyclobacteriaceae bacterium]|nr:response regulator [Cyclobacteriaceae bacterium]